MYIKTIKAGVGEVSKKQRCDVIGKAGTLLLVAVPNFCLLVSRFMFT